MSTFELNPNEASSAKTGLVLSGGGARGAYQAGVVRAIAEVSASAGIRCPFPILTGVSAGAINATYLAATSDNFLEGAEKLGELWRALKSERVFRTDALSAGSSGLKFFTDAALGALYRKKLARSLLDTGPLREFLASSLPFQRIGANLDQGRFEALAVTAMDYTDSNSVTFIQSAKPVNHWQRSRRRSTSAQIRTDHIMASSAIPLFFPPGPIGDRHYGDGCLRNTAPLSPAIHLGADRLIVVSVRKQDSVSSFENMTHIEPSLARILGVILNALLLDAIDVDMERLSRINHTILTVPERQRSELQLRHVDYLWLRPSQDIGKLAGECFDKLPRVIRYLVGGLGSSKEASELTSYLLFDPEFCGRLVEMGYEDGMNNREEILRFLQRP